MSYIEHPDSWFPEFNRVNRESGNGKCIPTPVNYMIHTCCNNCKFFAESEMEFAEGFCLKNVANDLSGQYILGSDTFYCSYHKFKV